jgi:hypothetical protein
MIGCGFFTWVLDVTKRHTGTKKLLILKNGFHSGYEVTPSIRLYDVAECARAQGLFYKSDERLTVQLTVQVDSVRKLLHEDR